MKLAQRNLSERRRIMIAHNILLYASDITNYKKAVSLYKVMSDYMQYIYGRGYDFPSVKATMIRLIEERPYPVAYVRCNDGEYLVRISYLPEFRSSHTVEEVIYFKPRK